MFTINLEDGREAPSKARKKGAKRLEFLVRYIYLDTFVAENIKEFNNLRESGKEINNNFKKIFFSIRILHPK